MVKQHYRYADKNAPKISKFTSALDLNSGKMMLFGDIRAQFFEAARKPDGPKAVAALREQFNFVCPHCKSPTAGLTFSFASQNPDGTIRKIGGTNFLGNPAHLKNLPENVHLPECKGIALPSESHECNEDKGYRIHLNLKNAVDRHPRNGSLFMRNGDGRIVILDPDLKDRESIEVSTVEKILPLLRSGQIERVKDSVVVYRNQKIAWNEFFIPPTDDADFMDHIQNLAGALLDGRRPNHPALLHFDLGKASVSRFQDEKGDARFYKFRQIHNVMLPGVKGPISIQPELRIQNQHLFPMMETLHKGHTEILSLVETPFIYKRDSKTNVYVMAFPLRDPDMLIDVKMDNISAIAHKRAQNGGSTPAEQPSLGLGT